VEKKLFTEKKNIEDFDHNVQFCSYYYDVAVPDPRQQVMTKDYLYCNAVFIALYPLIMANKPLLYASLGLVRNLPELQVTGLYSFTGSPEIYVTINDGDVHHSLYGSLDTIMSQKMEYNIKRIQEFKKGNLVMPLSNKLGFNEHIFERPLVNPSQKKARFLPYSRSSHCDRMIPENSHYFNKKPIIIPVEYEQLYNEYVNATSFKIRKNMLEKIPIEAATLIYQKSMGDTKIMSSKIRSTLGVKMGKFKPTLAQALVLANHRDFVREDDKGKFKLTITGQQQIIVNDAVVDRFYEARNTYDSIDS